MEVYSPRTAASIRAPYPTEPLHSMLPCLPAEALNQCRANLQRSVPQLTASQLELIEAEYLEGVARVRCRHPDATLCLLWLGSSVGNFPQETAAAFLHKLAAAAGGRMQLLLCTDLWKDKDVLHAAYKDSLGGHACYLYAAFR
jgi:L-histidine N-alpha-methyltransferase